jgi:FlaA1/EpsC-like NDP-sugar epimerase
VPGSKQGGPLTGLARAWRASGAMQTLTYVMFDLVIAWMATLAAYFARFSGAVPRFWASEIWLLGLAASAVFLALFWVFRLYHFVWKYVGVDMVLRTAAATSLGGLVLLAGDLLLSTPGGARFVPLSIPLILSVFMFVGASALRSLGRLQGAMGSATRGTGNRILIAGAGDAGSLLLRDIENQPELGFDVAGFVDDDKAKTGRMVRGVRVLGSVASIPEIAAREKIDEVFVAMPAASVAERRAALDACNIADVPIRIVPSIARDHGIVGLSGLRRVSIEDLLGRDPVRVDLGAIGATLTDKVVAVTGAAGSIGSELCRQIMLMRPRRLHLLEIDETRLYEVYLELRESSSDVPQMHICDIRNEEKTRRILTGAGVDVVFHAAAYKHVPLMELAPDEAVKMNVGGTRGVLRACASAGVDHFVLISTDKAVNPSSVMGATKALAERLTIAAARDGMKATAVRFGNVLGSRGSVVPLFEEQLRKGGPVLVTHPEVTRYFMTIPEAARLVLQAQAISDGGELLVLEMGEPVRIVDLARKMIALSGSPAEIEFQGLRPGEKLHEVLAHDGHDLIETGSPKVLRLNALPLVYGDFASRIDELIELSRDSRCLEALDAMGALLVDFDPSAAKRTCNVIDPGALGLDADMETLF